MLKIRKIYSIPKKMHCSKFLTPLPAFDSFPDVKKLIDDGIKALDNKEKVIQMNKYKHEFNKRLILTQAIQNAQDGEEIFDTHDKMVEKALGNITTKPDTIFLTINPRKEITYEILKKYVDKFTSKKFIVDYYGCYEVRDENFTGLHTHILFRYTGRPYNIQRAIKNNFKYVCDETNPHCCNIKFVKEELLKSKVDYIDGKKQDKKLSAVAFSDNWKKERKFGKSALLVGLTQINVEELN